MTTHNPQPASVAVGRRWPTTFRALRHYNYRLFFIGQLISLIGTWMQTIAQQWLIYRLTNSAMMLGVVNVMAVIPLLPLTLWGGSLADRFPKRSIIVVTQSAMLVQAFLLAALTWTGAVEVWHVLVLALALGVANAVDVPVRQAFVVEMVESKEDLTNAIGLNSTIFNAARAIGPAVAGLAVATTGETGAFFLNGVSFIAVIVALLMMRLPTVTRPVRPVKLGAHLVEGMRYVWSQQMLVVLLSLVGASAFLSMPYITLLPVFAQDVLRESAQPLLTFLGTWLTFQSPDALTYGLLMGVTGLGAVAGALFVASLPARARRGRWLIANSLLFPALLLAFAVNRSFALAVPVLVGCGFCFVVQNALANTLLQLRSPDELRGRVMSFYSLTFQGMNRLGGVQAGAMGDFIGAPLAVGIGALVCLVYGVFVAWRYPSVRNMV